MFVSLALTVLVSCLSLLSSAQQSQSAAQSPLPAVAPAAAANGVDRQVMLDVVVTDKSGNPIPSLRQEDFSLLDDKQPRAITSFHASDGASTPPDPPVQVIFLIDAVNAAFRGVGFQRTALDKFFRQNGGQLPLPMSFVVLTDTSTYAPVAPTRDGNSLADSVNSNQTGLRIVGRSQGFYGAVERFQTSLRTLTELVSYETKQPGRKLLIWLSPGWPLLTGPRVELTSKDQATIFKNVVTLSQTLREARITLYSVDPLGMDDAGGFRTFYYESFLKGVKSVNKVQSGNLALQVLAVQSGGRALNSSNDVARLIASCLDDAKAFYTLSFDSPPADNPNEYHSLEIKIDKPGLTARTRTGYYAQR
jgi:VWFA-related protein